MNSSPASITIQLNNEGAEFLNNSQYGKAVSSFTVALAKVKTMLVQDMEDDSESATPDHPPHAPASASGCSVPAGKSCATSLQADAMYLLDPSRRSIFCNPIVLTDRNERPTLELYNRYSFAIIFNLALAHHLSGMDSTELRDTKLRKALRLYEFAYSIQMQEDVQLQLVYTFGMVNNLGHIQETLGDQEKAQQCYQHLLSTLMYVMESGEGNYEGQWDIFLHNITHLILRQSPMAAAA